MSPLEWASVVIGALAAVAGCVVAARLGRFEVLFMTWAAAAVATWLSGEFLGEAWFFPALSIGLVASLAVMMILFRLDRERRRKPSSGRH